MPGNSKNPLPLERIAVDWNRDVVAIERVEPLDLNKSDRIDVAGGSPVVIAGDHDLV